MRDKNVRPPMSHQFDVIALFSAWFKVGLHPVVVDRQVHRQLAVDLAVPFVTQR
jgi:hypothetical protein